jgi:hypothetical protein
MERVLLTREVTAPPDFGFYHNADIAADQLATCWRMLVDGHSDVGEISEASNLSPLLVAALADRFW